MAKAAPQYELKCSLTPLEGGLVTLKLQPRCVSKSLSESLCPLYLD